MQEQAGVRMREMEDRAREGGRTKSPGGKVILSGSTEGHEGGGEQKSRGVGTRLGGCGETRTARVSRVGGRPQNSCNSRGSSDQKAGL